MRAGSEAQIVLDSGRVRVSDNPGAYRGQPGLDFLSAVPTSWDETRVLAGEIGEYVVVARRRGREWYVGAMTNERARTLQLPLDFLGGAAYTATTYADGARPTDLAIATRDLAKGKLDLELAPSGGAAVRFVPAQ